MIVVWVVQLFATVAHTLLSLGPTFTGPSWASGGGCSIGVICTALSKVGWLNGWLALDVLQAGIAFVAPVFVVAVAVRIAVFLYDKLPFKAT